MEKFLIVAFCVLFSFSCAKDNAPLVCEGDCLFLLENTEGKIIRMDCFSKLGIRHSDGNRDDIYILPDNLDNSYQENDAISFSAIIRANILEPEFPDPSINPNDVYQAELTDQ